MQDKQGQVIVHDNECLSCKRLFNCDGKPVTVK